MVEVIEEDGTGVVDEDLIEARGLKGGWRLSEEEGGEGNELEPQAHRRSFDSQDLPLVEFKDTPVFPSQNLYRSPPRSEYTLKSALSLPNRPSKSNRRKDL